MSDLKAISGFNQSVLDELQAAAAAEGATVSSWESLVAKQKETYTQQNEKISAVVDSVNNASTKKDSAVERETAAKAKADELRAKIDEKKKQKADTNASASSADPVADYATFIKSRGDLHREVLLRLAHWKKAGAYDTDTLRIAPLNRTFEFLDTWPSFEEETTVQLKALTAQADKFKDQGADVDNVTELSADFDALLKEYDANGTKLLREQARRQDYTEGVEKLMNTKDQLLHWCRQQRAALDGQKEPDAVQEFCASLQNSIGVMETNFLVVMEMAEQLMPNADVQNALIEVAEVWMALEVFAYEKLRATLVDIHQKSGLEAECKLFAEYSVRFKQFLESAEHLLEMPTDPESQAVTKPVLDNCKQLLADHDLHLIMVEHLSDFTIREECVKDHYNAIHRTIFSKLTLLTQSFVGHQGYARKQEYTDRLAELSDWIDCKSQNNAWKDLLSRVEKMRQLVEVSEVTTSDAPPSS